MKQWQAILIGAMGIIGSVHGALNAPMNGQVYDNGLNIYWLQDANVFKTLCNANDPLAMEFIPVSVPSAADICIHNGFMTWDDAEAWIARLNANNYLGHNDWRQWVVPNPTNDPSCSYQNLDAAGTDSGYNCTGSELGHLFNITLGNPNDGDGSNCSDPPVTEPDHCLQNTGPFNNLEPFSYWSGTEFALYPNLVWNFATHNGSQAPNIKPVLGRVWPVRPGQGATPVPVLPLWSLGLMGLVLVALARQRLR